MAARDVGGGAGDLLRPTGPPPADDEADEVGGVADLLTAPGPDPGGPWNGGGPPDPPGEAPYPCGMDLYQRCQMAKFDPFLSLDCARVEESNFAA